MNNVLAVEPRPEGLRCEQTSTDGALLRRWRQGEEEAASELVRRYCRRLHSLIATRCSTALAAHIEVEDIAQSVFSLVFQGVRSRGYAVADHQELWGLLLVLALNKIRNLERGIRCNKRDFQRIRQSGMELEQLASRDDAASAFLHLVMDDELREWPEAHRRMVSLRLEGHELADIASVTHRSSRTVERVLQNFRKKLGP